ncbi:MAG: hypothetical protein A2756_04475 [Candidatus Ryanbacteria bacterium RIFCSPHIGHO2_01_FULL_48_27]|uniref:DUF7674 domain-containing protein n=1 Tax=Candidatus Ryanbacteria bacterium RIFCSPHIGHO2_01_FULL_48_27 TaxID=1802115 RepID=A0A1G2G700_9BACT|nr:MAG: hypothetical protein A2756_04475 [Candidatus Ryanbacteria bacterium RIFCSPHIGHO2_01_FULL_48_27]
MQINRGNIVKKFLELFPQFTREPSFGNEDYSEIPYVFFGSVNTTLSTYVEQKENLALATAVIHWMDEIYNTPETDDYIRDMCAIEFFECADGSKEYAQFLLDLLTGRANIDFRRHNYIVENGGLLDPNTGEIMKYAGMNTPSQKTGKFITDIK